MWKRRTQTLSEKDRIDKLEVQVGYLTEFCQAQKLIVEGLVVELRKHGIATDWVKGNAKQILKKTEGK